MQGQISAAILQLLRLEWPPAPPSEWSCIGPKGLTEELQFPDRTYTCIKALDSHAASIKDIKDTAQRQLWSKASLQYCGSGIENGVNNDSMRV